MAAGLGFKTFNTGDVLSAADTNGYLMQGIWVFASATARNAAVTSPQEGNACYLKDTDVVQIYDGSTWVTQSANNAISANLIDAKGDLIAGSADNTAARLAVGTNGQVLTADSTASTGLKWATPAGGGGKVLQVVQATYSTSTSTTSSSAVDTGLSASITPSASTSKVLVMVTQPLYITKSSVYITEGYFKLLRGSTALTTNDYIFGNGVGTTSQTKELEAVWSISYLDSPSTTSSTTYKTQMSAYNTGTTTAQIGNTTSIMILMEIGA